jgi:hypothetical protein
MEDCMSTTHINYETAQVPGDALSYQNDTLKGYNTLLGE